ncbi:hypothetical protein HK101_005841 [Irineochytrium annulatum]|nr:hypothetical protein HK101_005841 [Irineochytrium annulatum]
MLDVQSFVSNYVLAASRSEMREAIRAKLVNGEPFEETAVAAVALIDISGFTSTTVQLAKREKVSAEVLSQTISDYLSEIISIVSTYEGDVVKFTGETILLAFADSKLPQFRDGTENAHLLREYRSMACCSDILMTCGMKDFAITPSGAAGQHPFRVGGGEVVGAHNDKIQMKLHVAIGVGEIRHVIIGTSGMDRCDYFICGDLFEQLSLTLHKTSTGEIGLTKDLAIRLGYFDPAAPPSPSYDDVEVFDHSVLLKRSFIRSALYHAKSRLRSYLLATDDRSMNLALTGTNGNLHSSSGGNGGGGGGDSTRRPSTIWSDDGVFCSAFLNQSLMWHLKQELKSSGLKLGDPFMDVGSVAMRKKSTVSTLSAFPEKVLAEYRRVSVLFIKLNFPFDAKKANEVFKLVNSTLVKFDGFVHQFSESVDNRGQTLLSIFGLPPCTHENNAKFAIQAAVAVSQSLQANRISPVTLTVTTNDVFLSILGNILRSEHSLLGDAVTAASRLSRAWSADPVAIFCDEWTMECVSGEFDCVAHPTNRLVGAAERGARIFMVGGPKNVQGVKRTGTIGTITLKEERHVDVAFIGYEGERKRVIESLHDWIGRGKSAVTIVEAESGLGKTFMSHFFLDHIKQNSDAFICRSQGTETGRFIPYFPFQSILRRLIQHGIGSLTDKVAKRLGQARAATNEGTHAVTNESKTFSVKSSLMSLQSLDKYASGGGILTGRKGTAKSTRPNNRDRVRAADIVASFMTAVDEPSYLAPLLNDILPTLKVEENDYTERMSGQVRKETLCCLIVSCIRKISEKSLLLISADDLQVYFLLLTEPQRDPTYPSYNAAHSRLLSHLPAHVIHLPLRGLSRRETQDIILWKLRKQNVKRLPETFLHHFHALSHGSPLLTDLQVDTLLLRQPPPWTDGSWPSEDSGGEKTTIESVLGWLAPELVEMMRWASVVGVWFDLNIVARIGPRGKEGWEWAEWIKEVDRFDFLVKVSRGDGWIAPEEELEFEEMFRFRHVSIHRAVYEAIPAADREGMHAALISYYSEQVKENPHQLSTLLPLVCFHSRQTTYVAETIKTLEMLANMFIARSAIQGKRALLCIYVIVTNPI